MRIRKNVLEHLTLTLAHGRNALNSSIKIGQSAIVERKWAGVR